jgi:hypothetical protein
MARSKNTAKKKQKSGRPAGSLRRLMTSEEVPNSTRLHYLTLSTSCPAKWLFVDTETGAVWHKVSDEDQWKNVGYVDAASITSMVILPSAHGSIPRFNLGSR